MVPTTRRSNHANHSRVDCSSPAQYIYKGPNQASNIKLQELMQDLTKRHVLGVTVGHMMVVEFSSAGCHTLTFCSLRGRYGDEIRR